VRDLFNFVASSAGNASFASLRLCVTLESSSSRILRLSSPRSLARARARARAITTDGDSVAAKGSLIIAINYFSLQVLARPLRAKFHRSPSRSLSAPPSPCREIPPPRSANNPRSLQPRVDPQLTSASTSSVHVNRVTEPATSVLHPSSAPPRCPLLEFRGWL